ncbi:MAG: DUF5671 domain-containing protein [Candidatus Zambryskibacteria bacterium]|nr:DUF5671 domain-containing protein [Candidatus Zambryskibacteria bacterium]
MEPQTKTSAKDFFLNLGAIVALYTLVFSLVNLLFTVIDRAYPPITNGYYYNNSASISWPVATLVIFFPIFILLMWFLEKEYVIEPERQHAGIHRWLTYITLFVAGLAIAGDLITVLYYFIDGQNLTTGFLLKVLALLVIASSIFTYYTSDIRGKLTSKSRIFWRIFAGVILVCAIIWGFMVLGSPATQRLYKYDTQKINDLMNIDSAIQNYYSTKNTLPKDFTELSTLNYYMIQVDSQTQKSYEYNKTGNTTYELCAEFNKTSPDTTGSNIYTRPVGYTSWTHPAGRYCFAQTINPNTYYKSAPVPLP